MTQLMGLTLELFNLSDQHVNTRPPPKLKTLQSTRQHPAHNHHHPPLHKQPNTSGKWIMPTDCPDYGSSLKMHAPTTERTREKGRRKKNKIVEEKQDIMASPNTGTGSTVEAMCSHRGFL